MYEDCKIYGPYLRKDGRLHMVLKYPNGKKTTVSFPKFLMENHIGRYLEPNETIDHIDCVFSNNSIENLRVIDRREHSIEDVIRNKPMDFNCPICNSNFVLSGRRLSNAIQNRRKGKAGPFCSRHCAGKYGKSVQMGGRALEVVTITPSNTTLKQSLYEETHKVEAAKTGKP